MIPSVTLITPVYNGMPYFKEYLECVLKQTWRPLQFICVDDGSGDDSFEYLESLRQEFGKKGIELKNVKIVHGGQAAAFNEALKLVTGDYITWCDADDLMTPDNIEKKALFLMDNPKVGIVRNDGIRIEEGNEERVFQNSFPADRKQQSIFDSLFHDTTYCYAGCYMIRTQLLFECYPEKKIPVSEEGQNLQLLLPPASRTECGYIPENLHIYRRRASGHSGRKRSFSESFQRMKNFTALKLEILNYCQCDRANYQKEALKIEEQYKKRLLESAVLKARGEMKREDRDSDIS